MAYNWELESVGNLLEESPQDEPSKASLDISSQMDEVEKRIEVAQYYRLLLQQSFFEEDTDTSRRVENEIREFVKGRLSVLLGVKEDKSYNTSFTNEQLEVLTKFAALGDDGPEVIRVLMEKFFKKTKKNDAHPQPKMKPAPKLRTVKTDSVRSEPQQQRAPERKAGLAPRQQPVQRQRRGTGVNVPKEYEGDPTLKVEGTKVYVQQKNELGELLWEKVGDETRPIMKDITPIAKPSGNIQPIPMPTMQQTQFVTQDQAQRVLRETDKDNASIVNQLFSKG